jgi:8-oxo-dGTP diphosphatase
MTDRTRRDRIDIAAAPMAGPIPALTPLQGKPASLLLVVAVALLDTDGRVLITRRPEGKEYAGLWEFPGGKVEAGETPERAALRELWEELGVEPCTTCLQAFAFASCAEGSRHLLMPLYLCRKWDGIPRPLLGQELAWVPPARLTDYAMPPADIPLAVELRERLR